jgi:hypothetical protein
MCKGNTFLGVRLDLHFHSDILVRQRRNQYSRATLQERKVGTNKTNYFDGNYCTLHFNSRAHIKLREGIGRCRSHLVECVQ